MNCETKNCLINELLDKEVLNQEERNKHSMLPQADGLPGLQQRLLRSVGGALALSLRKSYNPQRALLPW